MNQIRRSYRSGLPDLFTEAEWNAVTLRARLSRRQTQVVRLVCLGLTFGEAAQALSIAAATVRLHIRTLCRRFGVRDRVGIVVCLVLIHREIMTFPDTPSPSRGGRNVGTEVGNRA